LVIDAAWCYVLSVFIIYSEVEQQSSSLPFICNFLRQVQTGLEVSPNSGYLARSDASSLNPKHTPTAQWNQQHF